MHGIGQPTILVLIERYAERAALDAHHDSTHYRELLADQIRPLLTDRQVEITRAIATGRTGK